MHSYSGDCDCERCTRYPHQGFVKDKTIQEKPDAKLPPEIEMTARLHDLHKLTGDPDFDSMIASCIKILEVKGEDYTIGTKDRLHNFKTVAEFTGVTPEESLGIYLYKHMSSIFAYIKSGGKSQSEPIEGRIADVINYMLLFHKMVLERSRGNLK